MEILVLRFSWTFQSNGTGLAQLVVVDGRSEGSHIIAVTQSVRMLTAVQA